MSGYTLHDLTGWRQNFLTKSVQNNSGTFGSDFLSSESTVMVSGPAEYTSNSSELIPIGLVQNVQIAQQKQIQQINEIGSKKPVFIPGRTIVSGGIARVLFDGPSLMQSMYLRGPITGANSAPINPKDSTWSPLGVASDTHDHPTDMNGMTELGGYTEVTFKTANDSSEPTPGYFFINLASSFFNRPTGLGFILYDAEGQPYGGFYLENCYIQAHTFSIASQQTVLVENVSFRASAVATIESLVLP